MATTPIAPFSEHARVCPIDHDAIMDMYPHGDEPMPDAHKQHTHFVRLISTLRVFFADRAGAFVSGDIFVYYVEGDPTKSFAPDCFIAFGVDEDIIYDGSYLIWRAGKVPDFILEIGSQSTARWDMTGKRDLYESLEVPEFWLWDPSGGTHYGSPLIGLRLVDGAYQEVTMTAGVDGSLRGYSDALGLDLIWRPDDEELDLFDPDSGEYLRDHETYKADFEEAEAGRQAAEARAQSAEAGRQAAETRALNAEAEIERLREQIRRLQG